MTVTCGMFLSMSFVFVCNMQSGEVSFILQTEFDVTSTDREVVVFARSQTLGRTWPQRCYFTLLQSLSMSCRPISPKQIQTAQTQARLVLVRSISDAMIFRPAVQSSNTISITYRRSTPQWCRYPRGDHDVQHTEETGSVRNCSGESCDFGSRR
jgi:hypothetical protein